MLFNNYFNYQTYANTSPPIPNSLASLSVFNPFEVEIIAIPNPFNTFGNSSLDAYTLNPGLLILFKPSITLVPFSSYFKVILMIPCASSFISSKDFIYPSLNNISALHGRAEDLAQQKEYREHYDFCVSRAVANLATLSEYCIPFVKKKGYFISYKSEKITEEYEQAKKAIKILGGNYKNQVEFYLPQSDIYRNLFIIEKIDVTPKKYPRKAGMPSKEPIISLLLLFLCYCLLVLRSTI